MLLKANAKLNIGLNIIRKREDGFHDLETLFYPIYGLYDEILIERSSNFKFSSNIKEFNDSDNIIIKVVNVLEDFTGEKINVSIELNKKIPMGAGLGGGSSDAAFVLKGINNLLNLNIPENELLNLALKLGSDVPFFLVNKPAIGKGRGEILTPVRLDLSGFYITIVNPGIHVSTKEAFSKITPSLPNIRIEEVIAHKRPFEEWNYLISNDFEPVVFGMHPEIEEIKMKMIELGSIFCSMSGTGSTVFSIGHSIITELSSLIPNDYFFFESLIDY